MLDIEKVHIAVVQHPAPLNQLPNEQTPAQSSSSSSSSKGSSIKAEEAAAVRADAAIARSTEDISAVYAAAAADSRQMSPVPILARADLDPIFFSRTLNDLKVHTPRLRIRLGLVQRADVLRAIRRGAATTTLRRRRVEDRAQSIAALSVLVDDLHHLVDVFLTRGDVECVAFLVHNEIDFNDLTHRFSSLL